MSVSDLLSLKGKTVLVTGASGGIGAAISHKLAQAGARVIVHYNGNEKTAQAVVQEISALECIRCDLSREANIEKMVRGLIKADIMPDLLVNNAAIQTVGSLLEADEPVWRDINDVNLGGTYGLTRHVAKELIARGKSGAIVNIASIEGLDPAENHAHYGASKAAVLMYTKACALELGQHNIRVNAVAPGLIARPGLEQDWPQGVKRWCDRAPLGRLGTGEDVANSVLFLLSDAAMWISGNTLVVDGGMSAQNRW